MNLILVEVPGKPTVGLDGGMNAAMLQIGERGEKFPARLLDPNPRKYSGREVLCEAVVEPRRNQKRELVDVVILRPAKKGEPTSKPIRTQNGRIKLTALQ